MRRRAGRGDAGRAAAALGAALAAVAVGLLAAELVLRALLPLPPGEAFVTLQRQELPGLAPQVLYELNAFGFRTDSLHTREKPPDTLRVVALGASTVDQTTQSFEDTWYGVLARELRPALAERGVRLEVAGFGRGGWRVRTLLPLLRERVLAFDPDLVITLMGINDLSLNGGPDYAFEGFPDAGDLPAEPARWLDAANAPVALWGDACAARLQLCRRVRLLHLRLRQLAALRRGKAVEWHTKRLPERRAAHQALPSVAEPERSPDALREFREGMRVLLERLALDGVDALVLGQPVLWSADMTARERATLWFYVNTPEGPVRAGGAWLQAEMQRFNAAQRDVARDLGFPYVALDGAVPKDLDHFFDDCHYTDRGSARLAREIRPVVRERLLRRLEARAEGGGGAQSGSR